MSETRIEQTSNTDIVTSITTEETRVVEKSKCIEEVVSQVISVEPISKRNIILSLLPLPKDIFHFSWIMMFSLTGLACYHMTRLKYFDTRDYYVYQGTSGTYELMESEGIITRGRAITTVKAGEKFAWVTDFCTGRNVNVTVDFELVMLATPESTEVQLNTRHSIVTPLAHRCGPALNSWLIPEGSPNGDYEIRRIITVRKGFDIPFIGSVFGLSETIEPIHITVRSNNTILKPSPFINIDPAVYKLKINLIK